MNVYYQNLIYHWNNENSNWEKKNNLQRQSECRESVYFMYIWQKKKIIKVLFIYSQYTLVTSEDNLITKWLIYSKDTEIQV